MADKRFIDFRVDSTPGSGSYLVGHDSAGTEFRIAVANLLGSIEVPEAQSIYVQYSANGSSWVTVWTSGCKFMRIKIGAGAWSNAMAIADVVNVATMVKVGNTLVGSGSDYVELEAGSNVTLTPDAENNKVTISATGGGGSTVQSDWNQSDSSASDYIKNKPTIPSKTSDLSNDSGFLTQHQDISGKVDKVTGKGLSTNDYTTTEKNKLAGIAAGAEVNVQSDWNQSDSSADDYVKNKPTIPTKTSDLTNDSGFLTQHQDISGKVDKETGKGLSTNDYTTTEKNKLAGIAAGAEVNVQSDWNQSDSSADDYVKNKPTIPTVNNSTISFTQGGVSKGSFTLNQSSGATIALDAGMPVIVVDTVCYGEPNSSVTISEAECFDLLNNYFIYLDGGGNWNEDTSIPVVDGMIIYAREEDAYYIYDSNYGLKPLSKGKSLFETNSNGSYYIEAYLPIADSFGELVLTALNMGGSSCYLNLNGMFGTNSVEFYGKSIGSVHTICLKNNKSSDVNITVSNLYYGSLQGFLSSGLDANNTFTLKAGEHAEISVIFKDSGEPVDENNESYGNYALASIIVKNDFVENLTWPD